MTNGALRVSAIALGAAAFVSLASLSTASADDAAPSGTPSATSGAPSSPSQAASTPSEATPSLNEPAPTPGWAEGGPPSSPSEATAAQTRHYPNHYTRHYAWRNGHRYVYYSNNPVANAATGVVGSVADLGSLAAYPIYCFPRYGSCPVYWPYR